MPLAATDRFEAGKHRIVEFIGNRLRPPKPGIDFLVGRGEQCLELVEPGFVQASQRRFGIGAEDQIDLLEAAPLGPKQKPFAAVLRRATLPAVIHGAHIALARGPNKAPNLGA